MGWQFVDGGTRGPGVQIQLGLTDSLYVARQGSIVAVDGAVAIRGEGYAHDITVAGSVWGLAGLQIGAGGAGPGSGDVARITVTGTGQVGGTDSGMLFAVGGLSVVNHGLIEGELTGLRMIGDVADATSIIRNFAEIRSFGTTVALQGASRLQVWNDGTISGRDAAIACGAGSDLVRNTGHIDGAIRLGDGNNVYDGRWGILNDTVETGAGDDLFIPGAGREAIVAGGGIDTLRFDRSGGVTVDLADEGRNTGLADGDSYGGVERIIGSSRQADRLSGDAAANRLEGRGGADRLDGRAGADMLVGSSGHDILRGGSGADRFVFIAAGDAGDRIVDFNGTAGDRITLSAVFDPSLAEGPIAAGAFHSGTSNRAVDAGDRLIFRTTDSTLWYDTDGRGGVAAVLLADLQSGAQMRAAWIEVLS